jgi:hypothetical protein
MTALVRAAEIVSTRTVWYSDGLRVAEALADAGLLVTDEIRMVLDAVGDWRREWLVPVVCDADTISEGDEYLALAYDKFSPPTSPVGGEAPGAPCTPTGHHITARDGGARGVVDPEASPDPAPVGRVSTPTGAPSQGGAA